LLFQVGNAAYHNDKLYEELRPSIPQLTKLLVAPEEDKTKGNAAGALSNLVRNSDLLCQDIISQGAIQVSQLLTVFLFTGKCLAEGNIALCPRHDLSSPDLCCAGPAEDGQ
jgi:hypothetical protein